jgi:hypothetical protein
MRRWIPAAVSALLVVATGAVHGYWTGRWDAAGIGAVDAAALEQIPMQLGEWQGQPLELNAREAESYSAVLYRRYIHQRTGQTVFVVLVAGRPGPVSIHSPDYCYPASGYDPAAWVPYHLTADATSTPAEFKTAVLTKTQAAGQSHVRVLWSWYAAGRWSVPDNPRLAFAGQPCLYKLHVVREAGAEDSPDGDPSVELLREILAAFQRQVASKE